MSGHEPCLRTENDDRGDGEVGRIGRTRFDWERLQQATDLFQRETACRQALDRINLGLHTSADVALLRRELNL